jgi:hypothetical protein
MDNFPSFLETLIHDISEFSEGDAIKCKLANGLYNERRRLFIVQLGNGCFYNCRSLRSAEELEQELYERGELGGNYKIQQHTESFSWIHETDMKKLPIRRLIALLVALRKQSKK